MSTTRPMEPELPGGDDGIPTADAGTGAPPPARGFGPAGGEPDVLEEPTDRTAAELPVDTPFRTPDPTEIGRDVR